MIHQTWLTSHSAGEGCLALLVLHHMALRERGLNRACSRVQGLGFRF